MTPEHKVLEVELTAIRVLRLSPDLGIVRAALNREEVLIAEIKRISGLADNVVPMAVGFARREQDAGEGKGGKQ